MRRIALLLPLFVALESSAISMLQELRTKYKDYSRDAILHFVDDLREDDARLLEKEFGLLAIKVHEAFRSERLMRWAAIRVEEDKKFVEKTFIEMLSKFTVEYASFWAALKDETKEMLYLNPDLLLQMLSYMDRLDGREITKQRLANFPDALRLLAEFPCLAECNREDFSSLVYVLSMLELKTLSDDDKSKISKAIREHGADIAMLVMKDEEFSGLPAMTFLAVPEMMSESKDLDVAFNENMLRWSAVCSQVGYISSRMKVVKDWKSERDEILQMIFEPKISKITAADWYSAVVASGVSGGKLLRTLKDYKEKYDDPFRDVEEFLAMVKHCSGENGFQPIVILNLLKFTRDTHLAEDFRLLKNICCDRQFDIGVGNFPLPLMTLGEIPADSDDDERRFINLVEEHKNALFAYLNDKRWGDNVLDRYRSAQKSNLEDMKYDDGMIKSVLTKVPVCGNIANVAVKAAQGYPISKSEWVDAGVDGVGLLLTVATAGANQVATYAANAAKIAKVASNAEKLRKISQYAKTTANTLNNVKELYNNGITKVATKKLLKSTIFSSPKRRNRGESLNDAVRADGIFKDGARDRLCRTFGLYPVRSNGDRRILLNDYNGDSKEVTMPREYAQWDKVLRGKTILNSILLVTVK